LELEVSAAYIEEQVGRYVWIHSLPTFQAALNAGTFRIDPSLEFASVARFDFT
jgi:hypothetical protein